MFMSTTYILLIQIRSFEQPTAAEISSHLLVLKTAKYVSLLQPMSISYDGYMVNKNNY